MTSQSMNSSNQTNSLFELFSLSVILRSESCRIVYLCVCSVCVCVLLTNWRQTCWWRCVNSIDRLQVPPRVGSKIFAKDRCETDRMTIRFSGGFYPVDPVTGRAHRSDRLRLRAPTGAERGCQNVAPTVPVRLISSNQINHRLTSPISSKRRNCGSRI